MNLLLVGDFDADEMEPARRRARTALSCSSERSAPGLSHPAAALADGAPIPDIVLVAQRHPDEYAESDVAEALARLPLARWVVCLGAWCESSLRTGSAWPPAVCVPARLADARLVAEAAALRGALAPPPFTASREETVAFEAEAAPIAITTDDESRSTEVATTAAVVSPDASLEETAAAFLRRAGWRIVEPERADLLICDVDPFDVAVPIAEDLRRRSAARGAIALMTLPTPADVARLRQAGFDPVLPKLALASLATASLSSIARGD